MDRLFWCKCRLCRIQECICFLWPFLRRVSFLFESRALPDWSTLHPWRTIVRFDLPGFDFWLCYFWRLEIVWGFQGLGCCSCCLSCWNFNFLRGLQVIEAAFHRPFRLSWSANSFWVAIYYQEFVSFCRQNWDFASCFGQNHLTCCLRSYFLCFHLGCYPHFQRQFFWNWCLENVDLLVGIIFSCLEAVSWIYGISRRC